MSRQRKKHPNIVWRRKIARKIDKLASKNGYTSQNPRGRRILRMRSVDSEPYGTIPPEALEEAMLAMFVK